VGPALCDDCFVSAGTGDSVNGAGEVCGSKLDAESADEGSIERAPPTMLALKEDPRKIIRAGRRSRADFTRELGFVSQHAVEGCTSVTKQYFVIECNRHNQEHFEWPFTCIGRNRALDPIDSHGKV